MEEDRAGERATAAAPYAQALHAVASLVERLDRPVTIIGGLAVIAHGFARATADIDLAVVAEPGDVEHVLRVPRGMTGRRAPRRGTGPLRLVH